MTEPTSIVRTTLIRMTMDDKNTFRFVIDYGQLFEIDERDTLFVVGCLRQLERRLLENLDEREVAE